MAAESCSVLTQSAFECAELRRRMREWLASAPVLPEMGWREYLALQLALYEQSQ